MKQQQMKMVTSTLTYTWGDKEYTVQNYKGTVYDKNRYDANVTNKEWYKTDVDTRYTDAIDNYNTREKIDDEIAEVTNKTATTIDKMDSTTPTMGISVEYTTTTTIEPTTDKFKSPDFKIENIDFGIVERARQDLALRKRVNTFKVTLANGQVIADMTIDEKGNITGERNHVTYMGPSSTTTPKNGLVKLELDNELIQGATVEIKYEIKVQNNSEIDYDSKGYYCYGEKGEEIVKIKASGVYDYLDNTMIANDENTEWETKTIVNYNEKVSKPTIMEEYFKYQSSSIDSSGNTEIRVWYEEFKEQYATAIKNWNITEIKEARKKKLADKTILHNANLEGEIAPGDSKQASLTASKILTNTDEIELNNDIEITEATRNKRTGRKVTPQYSFLYDRGETVTITTPTGENKNYILITIVAISFFVILGTGIVFIKKKILK